MDVLPDSRLVDSNFGAVMANWTLPDGSAVRIEWVPVFCANCGVPYGYVPKESTAWACWLCQTCFEKHGAIAGTYAQPDAEFCQAVEQEMLARFGRTLTADELILAEECGQLGKPLELLARESPYPVRS